MLPIVATSGQTAIDIENGTKNNVRSWEVWGWHAVVVLLEIF
jgi:hypothetical protein